ncbi:hypothetical protein P2318_22965 [Myxococcaceae bacterium GXIMD 01537]
MKRGLGAALAAMLWLSGCGGGSLPPTGEPPPGTDGPVDLPGTPVVPDPNNPSNNPDPNQPTAPPSLWPLTPGSTWTYQIEDPALGRFTKTVRVEGPSDVPQTNPAMRAVLVSSRQERTRNGVSELYVERSWQLELTEGFVVRLREEDFQGTSDSDLTSLRFTRWATPGGTPAAIMKSLSADKPAAWKHTDVITEVTTLTGDPNPEVKGRTYVWVVEKVNDTVTVPAGTFTNATKLVRTRLDKEGNPSKERTYWLVPGVGKVREEGERTELLQSYDVKK